jgi:hypothetical protein
LYTALSRETPLWRAGQNDTKLILLPVSGKVRRSACIDPDDFGAAELRFVYQEAK